MYCQTNKFLTLCVVSFLSLSLSFYLLSCFFVSIPLMVDVLLHLSNRTRLTFLHQLSDNGLEGFEVTYQVEFMCMDEFTFVPQQPSTAQRKDVGVHIGAGLADVGEEEGEVACPMLQGLVLSNNNLRSVPLCIAQLRQLTSLKVSLECDGVTSFVCLSVSLFL